MAKAAREREAEAARNREQRAGERALEDRTKRLEDVIRELGKRLMLMPNGAPSEDALTRLYHETLNMLPERRPTDAELIRAMDSQRSGPAANGASEVCV